MKSDIFERVRQFPAEIDVICQVDSVLLESPLFINGMPQFALKVFADLRFESSPNSAKARYDHILQLPSKYRRI